MTLDQWMDANGVNDADFAQQIARHRTTVTRYRRCEVMPSYEIMRRIKEVTGGAVGLDAWEANNDT